MREAKPKRAMRSIAQSALLLSSVPAFICIAACGGGDPPLTADPAPGVPLIATTPEPASGTLALALQLAGGLRIDTVSYVVLGPHFTKSGALDVSSSSTISGVIGGIPLASGYSLTLNANSVGAPQAQCDGSAGFNIVDADVTTVPVHLTCHESSVMAGAAAPIPPVAILVLGVMLLGLGGTVLRRDPSPSGRS